MGRKLPLALAPFRIVQERMAETPPPLNDNQRPTRAELEASNRELKASLKRSEDLVSDCKGQARCSLWSDPSPSTLLIEKSTLVESLAREESGAFETDASVTR